MNRNVILSIAISLFIITSAVSWSQAQRADTGLSNSNETRIFSLINHERSRTGLSSLSWNGRLADLARSYSQTMAREGFFDHIDRNGDDVVQRARHMRIRGWQRIGENLFECEPTDELASLAIRGWMHSPTHRDNILDPDWRDTGIGIAYAGDGEIYITEIFSDD